MPNHEENYVVILGEPAKIRAFVNEGLRDVTDEEREKLPTLPEKILDFNLVLPMPEILGKMSSPVEFVQTQEEADRKNAEWNSGPRGTLNGGDQIRFITEETARNLIEEHGALDWYAWSTSNWGTKWGAYQHSHYELRFLKGYGDDAEVYGRVDLHFQTAWSQPQPILEKIQERWGVTVYAVTQDEGGFPDVYFPDEETVKDSEALSRVVTYEFDSWHTEVDEPEVVVIEESAE